MGMLTIIFVGLPLFIFIAVGVIAAAVLHELLFGQPPRQPTRHAPRPAHEVTIRQRTVAAATSRSDSSVSI